MRTITIKLLAIALGVISLTPHAACAKGQRQILGHAQARQCPTPLGGADGSPAAEQCIAWSVPSTINIYNVDLELITQVTSDGDGYFEIGDLKPGTYLLAVSAIDPRATAGRYFPIVQSITLHKKQDAILDFYLGYRAD